MSAPYYADDTVTVWHGDCLDVLRTLPDVSVDAVVTDPPYGLANTSPEQVADTLVRWVNGDRDYIPSGAGFMGNAWDAFVPPVAVWDECLRVLKPGGHLLSFAGTRTVDLMTLGLRLAGFEIRDSIAWLHGQGFAKSHDVSKAIDKSAGAEREVARSRHVDDARFSPFSSRGMGGVQPGTHRCEHCGRTRGGGPTHCQCDPRGTPVTPDAEVWQGWGTALKPSFEPIVVARKPLAGTVAANVLAHGTGALNIDASRIGTSGGHWDAGEDSRSPKSVSAYGDGLNGRASVAVAVAGLGRWPANVVLDEHQAAVLDEQTGITRSRVGKSRGAAAGDGWGMTSTGAEYDDHGGASRFFPVFRYEAKAPTSERPRAGEVMHPTVKPLDLMRWLVRLVTPPGGIVLEPFAGSGTTAEACVAEGFRCIAIEREADYLPLIVQRLQRRDVTAPATVEIAPGAMQDGFDFGEATA